MPDLAPLRLAQANHGIFYGPQYAAMSLGFFRDEGLDVQFSTADNGPGVAERLLRDEIDVGRAGPIRTLVMAERGHALVNVAEVNSRGGFYLLGRRATAQFAWSDLAGACVIAWGEPAIPWLCTAHVLEREGVDLKSVRVIRDVAGDKIVDAFRSGIGDYIAQFQPEAELLLADGTARTVVSMAEAIGPIPFSSYVVTPRFLARHPDRAERFLRGFQRALSWVHSHPAGEIAAAIAPFFAGVERSVLERSVERYLQTGPWPHDAILRKPGFEYLQDIVVKGGVVARRYAYEAHVNTEIASRVAASR